MLDLTEPMYACLVSPEGVPCLPIKWGSNELCPWRFFLVQMTDEEEQPLPQPWETPVDYTEEVPAGMWVIDLQHLPGGWELVSIDAAQWRALQTQAHQLTFDRTARQWARVGIAQKEEEADVTISHWVRGGKPAYRIKQESKKSEKDFPGLLFTHVPGKRKDPLSHGERLGAAVMNAAVLQMAQETLGEKKR